MDELTRDACDVAAIGDQHLYTSTGEHSFASLNLVASSSEEFYCMSTTQKRQPENEYWGDMYV